MQIVFTTSVNPTTVILNATTVILERSEGSVFLLSQSFVRADRFFAYAQNDTSGSEVRA